MRNTFQITRLRFAGMVLLSALCLIGCSKKSEPVQQSNDSSEKPDISRIIAMAPNLTEILFALGLDDQIVAVTQNSNYPQQAHEKINVGSFWQPDIETVLTCRPTLVVTLGFGQQSTLAKRLENIGCQTLKVDIDTIDQLYDAIRKIGQCTETTSKAEEIINRLTNKENELASRPESPSRPKVLWVIQREPLRVAGTETFASELIKIAGGVNAIGDTMQQYPPISMETVLGIMPDIIIEPSHEAGTLEKQKSTAPDFYKRYNSIPAVRNQRIYVVDGDLVTRLGPRLDQGMQLIADCIQPAKGN